MKKSSPTKSYTLQRPDNGELLPFPQNAPELDMSKTLLKRLGAGMEGGGVDSGTSLRILLRVSVLTPR